MKSSIILLICFLSISFALKSNTKYSVVLESGKWKITEGDQGAAWAFLREESDKIGWNVLEIVTNSSYSDSIQAQAAGYIEGALTQRLIWNSYRSFVEGKLPSYPSAFLDFVTGNDRWVRQQAANPTENIDYWGQVALILYQFDGLVLGYNSYAPQQQQINAVDLLIYQLTWEIGDIYTALNLTQGLKRDTNGLPGFNDLHCSSIIKPSPDGTELLVSHVTWTGYRGMLRVFKHYTTNFNAASNKSPTSSFSSFPGNFPSGDDWFVTSSKLVVMETTNGVMNPSLFYQFVKEETVMYWIRVIVANRMSSNGKEWTDIFSLYNSGTYNNQWMVVNMNLFTPNEPLKQGTLWVAEQVPGYIVGADQTSVVIESGYWASYNVPFYPFIYNISNYPAYYQKYGNAYSYTQCARAQIFRRDQGLVYDLDDLKSLMRYNEWQTDPLALRDACRGISARCDLNPPWVVNSLNGYSAFGAIDCKVSNYKLMQSLETEAVSGPTWDSQPPFAWTKEWEHVPHYGQPKVFAFDFVSMRPAE